jgi:hypothetical protein
MTFIDFYVPSEDETAQAQARKKGGAVHERGLRRRATVRSDHTGALEADHHFNGLAKH